MFPQRFRLSLESAREILAWLLTCPPRMFKVLHSSAGAGKTHALVKHYLTLCLGTSDHGVYRHVLALTFTNKAAAEMKERVMRYLEELAHGPPYSGALTDVANHLMGHASIGEVELTRRADVVLAHMLHHWNEVAISTIDAFTHRVVRPFARDLRLDHDLRMTTEVDHYRQRAVNSLIDQTGSNARTTELLTQTCLQLLQEERPWDPTRPLYDLSKELINERSIVPLLKARDLPLEEILELKDRLNESVTTFRQRMRVIGREAVGLFAKEKIQRSDIAHGGSLLGHFQKLAAFAELRELPGPNTRKPIETGKWHSAKANGDAITALQRIAERITELFYEAEKIFDAYYAHFCIQRAVLRELLPAYTLHSIDTTLEDIKHEDGVAFFSDLTRRVAEVVKDEPVPFIYERIGERYRHFLIDEFQDTSLLQWNALLPLVDNALASGGTVLLVGDGKQAIYRWRNGEVRLFVELPKLFGMDPTDEAQIQRAETLARTYVQGEPLAHNRRSAQRVIAFNNQLFRELGNLLHPSLKKVYHDLEQQSWLPSPGTVRITLDEEGRKGTELHDAIVGHALSSLQHALNQGFDLDDVAFLVRSKRTGRMVATHLLAHGYSVVSPDGLQLAADPAVQLLVECLRHLVRGDEGSAARALQWHAIVTSTADKVASVAWSIPLNANGRPDPVQALKELLGGHQCTALRTSVATLITDIARTLGLAPGADGALLIFLDEVHAWSTEHTQDIAGFLDHWDRSGGQRSNAAPHGTNAVQVMTVHKSKGLEFPVVIVPDARMVGPASHGEFFWIDPGDAVPELEIALARDGKALRELELPELEEERTLRVLDGLNLLYVAFTRASQHLHVFVPKAHDVVTKGLLAFVQANPDSCRTALEPAPERKEKMQQPLLTLRDVTEPLADAPWRIRTEGPGTPNVQKERDFGTTVHAVLANTTTLADLPTALATAVEKGGLQAAEAADLHQRLSIMLNGPPLIGWFAPGANVRSEAAIITAEGYGLRPDRVMRDAAGLHVLEIKTGKPTPAHERQLGEYLRTIRAMGEPLVTGTIWYVSDGTIRNVD